MKKETNWNRDSRSKDFDSASVYLRNLLSKGPNETIDFQVTLDDRPSWLDEEKFKRGQAFARKYLIGTVLSELVAMPVVFAVKTGLAPLIFTEKTSTPYKAAKRYMTTAMYHMSWYEEDLWSKENNRGRRSMHDTREIHKNVYTKLAACSEEEIQRKCTLGDEQETALWCPMKNILLDDFKGCSSVKNPIPYNDLADHKVWLNQFDMVGMQFSFVALVATFPRRFGVKDEERGLEEFIHMWRGLGYLLGIKDEFNFCNTDLEGVRERTRYYIDNCLKPSLSRIDSDWEHMVRCAVVGPSLYMPVPLSFEAVMKYAFEILEVPTPKFSKSISYYDYLFYSGIKILNALILRVPGVLALVNAGISFVVRRACNAKPEQLNKIKATSFPYMNQPGKKSL